MATTIIDNVIRMASATSDAYTPGVQAQGLFSEGGAVVVKDGGGVATLFTMAANQYIDFGKEGHYFPDGLQATNAGTLVVFLA